MQSAEYLRLIKRNVLNAQSGTVWNKKMLEASAKDFKSGTTGDQEILHLSLDRS